MRRRVAAAEKKLADELVDQIVRARFEEETAHMLQVLDGNVSEPTRARVEEIIQRYTQERYGA
jgi:hypothetical protein